MDFAKIDEGCLKMIEAIFIASLVIHGAQDMLVPLNNAEDLYRHLGTQEKELLVIPSATHNDIMPVGFKDYFNALQRFVERTDRIQTG